MGDQLEASNEHAVPNYRIQKGARSLFHRMYLCALAQSGMPDAAYPKSGVTETGIYGWLDANRWPVILAFAWTRRRRGLPRYRTGAPAPRTRVRSWYYDVAHIPMRTSFARLPFT